MVGTSYWFTWFPGSALATVTLFMLGWKGLKAFAKITAAGQEILETAPLVRQIHTEFHPNGGGSLRDRVEALNTWKGHVDRKLERMDAALERIEEKG